MEDGCFKELGARVYVECKTSQILLEHTSIICSLGLLHLLKTDDYVSAPFLMDRIHLYQGFEDPTHFFKPARRSLLVHHILINLDIRSKEDRKEAVLQNRGDEDKPNTCTSCLSFLPCFKHTKNKDDEVLHTMGEALSNLFNCIYIFSPVYCKNGFLELIQMPFMSPRQDTMILCNYGQDISATLLCHQDKTLMLPCYVTKTRHWCYLALSPRQTLVLPCYVTKTTSLVLPCYVTKTRHWCYLSMSPRQDIDVTLLCHQTRLWCYLAMSTKTRHWCYPGLSPRQDISVTLLCHQDKTLMLPCYVTKTTHW
ncbi:hypothetical protein KUTeg_002756 [Tegillarca granosa]|uniref:Anoctamin dimerisation domain-containing protein n=1 Tax=Tegillarca granosa TaxID=220873 RepID=A0ABQ9FU86_TEGGR|nr:hypothetical protein KUTeg_002756 [Tegillarca granosa]